jgi:O-antigen ligase
LRVGQTRWSFELIADAPLFGHGAGSFKEAQTAIEGHQRAVERRPNKVEYLTRGQPHSTPLHVLVTTGVVGGVVAAGVIGLSLGRAGRMTLGAARWREAEPLMAAVPFAILLWVIGSFFDSYHLSGDRAGLLFVLISMAVARPERAREERGE